MKKIYSVYDAKMAQFGNPMFMLTNGEALRGWADIVNNKESAYNQHPEDYTLFELGIWNEDKAEIVMLPAPLAIGPALEFVKQ
ncbi:MAG: nonstructural protein [Arizlama microvirus]|nr:MAG: nonstructural protein [Arizlama microvirus]